MTDSSGDRPSTGNEGFLALLLRAPFRASLLLQLAALCLYGYAVHGEYLFHRTDQHAARFRAVYVLSEVKGYHRVHGEWPASLEVLLREEEVEERRDAFVDPWGRRYVYETVDGTPVVRSYGSDGAPGGALQARDLVVGRRERWFQDWPTPWEYLASGLLLSFVVLLVIPCSIASLFVSSGVKLAKGERRKSHGTLVASIGLFGGLTVGTFLLFVATLGWS